MRFLGADDSEGLLAAGDEVMESIPEDVDTSGTSKAARNGRVAYSERSRRTNEGTPGAVRVILLTASITTV